MTLCDTSPLVALIKQNEVQHDVCAATLSSLRGPLLTTWPCFTEAIYLLGSYGGWPAMEMLWSYVESRALRFYDLTVSDWQRMKLLMQKYRDRPMDLADASLVAAAEALNQKTVFTLDSDFYVYRFRDTDTFQVIP